MKKSELIKLLQSIDHDFEVEIPAIAVSLNVNHPTLPVCDYTFQPKKGGVIIRLVHRTQPLSKFQREFNNACLKNMGIDLDKRKSDKKFEYKLTPVVVEHFSDGTKKETRFE